MSRQEESGILTPWIRLGLNHEQAKELGRGNPIHKLQQNFHALSNEVAQLSIDLREVLAHLREDPEGGCRRAQAAPRDDSSSSLSSSSQAKVCPIRERRPLRQPADDLRDMKFDSPKFKGNQNPDLFIEWV